MMVSTPHVNADMQLPSGTQCPHVAAAELGDGQQMARQLFTCCLAYQISFCQEGNQVAN